MARNKKKKSNVISVDFTGVETSGNITEGRQALTVVECEVKTSENSGNDYLNFKLKGKGGNMFHTCSLVPQALFNLRGILEAMGHEVPDGPLDVDTEELIGEEFGGEVEHETYQGKKKGVLVDVFPLSELDDDAEEEEGEEEPEELTLEDIEEMDKDELIEVAKENEIKLTARIKKSEDKIREAIIEALELDSEEEAEEESDELTYEELEELEKDELIELAKEHGVKLTARDKKSTDKMVDKIAEALELEPEEEGEEGDDDNESQLTADDINGMDKDELVAVAEEAEIKVLARVKKSLPKFRSFLIEELGLDEDAGGDIKKGSKVTFEDDGEELEGKVTKIEDDVAFVMVDGEEWEVDLEDLTEA